MTAPVDPVTTHEHLGDLCRRLYARNMLKRPWEEVAHCLLIVSCHHG